MSNRLYGSSPATAAQMTLDMNGKLGGILIANTAVVTGRFGIIQALADTVIASMTSVAPGLIQTNLDTDGVVTAVPLAAGAVITGNITSIQLTSGTVLAYNAP